MDISNSSAHITYDFDALAQVLYVRSYMESLFLNLISNALKYRHPDRNPQIHIKSYLVNGNPAISIQDNGLGIDLDLHREKLFGMFSTFHEHPQSKGIGLFITKTQIEALGGSIEVNSKVNVGTCFTIYLGKA